MNNPSSSRPPNFELIIRHFCSSGVEFVIIGGLAASIHGSSYVTVDVDFCYNRTPQNLECLARALTTIHAKLRSAPSELPFRPDAATLKAGLNFTFSTDLGDIDIFGEIAGLGTFAEVVKDSEELILFGYPVRVLSLDGLIRAKRATARRKDLIIVPELEAIRELRKEKEASEGNKKEESPDKGK